MKSLIVSIVALLLFAPFVYATQTKLPTETIDSWHNTAIRLKNEGKYSEAEALFKKILTAEPGNANAQFDLGNVYLFQKRYDEAIACYDEAANLGLDKKFSYISARDILREALTRLDERYKLIIRKIRPPKSPYCLLLGYYSKNPYVLPQEKYCSLPDEYWRYGWNKRLSFPEKYCFMINLCKAGASRGRVWTGYRKGLMEEFNLGRDTIIRGMKGLRRLNIIEIEYPPYPEGGGYAARLPMRFRLLGLYSPEILQKEKERLAKHYGKERFEQAAKYAEIVYKDNDIQVIEDIIKKIEEYGAEQVDKAFGKISHRSPDNPKRSYKYLVGILQTEAEEE